MNGNHDLDQIRTVLPDIAKDEEVVSAADNLRIAKAYKKIAISTEGKLIIDSIKREAADIMYHIRASFLDMNETQMRSKIAAYNEQLNLLELFMTSGRDVKLAQNELDQLVINKQFDQ